MSENESSDKEGKFSPRRELLILMRKEPNGSTCIRVEDQRDGSLLVERTAFGFEEALFARLQEAQEAPSARVTIPDFEGMIDNAAGASQSRELLDDQITRGAVKANIYDPLVRLLKSRYVSVPERKP